MARIKNTAVWGRETARERYQSGGNVVPLSISANENRNLQIPDDPYTMGIINKQWSDMVKKSNQPTLKIVPSER